MKIKLDCGISVNVNSKKTTITLANGTKMSFDDNGNPYEEKKKGKKSNTDKKKRNKSSKKSSKYEYSLEGAVMKKA